MSPAQELIIGYILEKSPAEPISRRLQLYRALAADLPPTSADFKTLTAMADELEHIESTHLELALDFKRRSQA